MSIDSFEMIIRFYERQKIIFYIRKINLKGDYNTK